MEQQFDITLPAKETGIYKIHAFSLSYSDVSPGMADIMSGSSHEIIFNGGNNTFFILAPYSKNPVHIERKGKLLRITVDPELLIEWFGSENVGFSSGQNTSTPFLTQLFTLLSTEASKEQIIEKRYTMSLATAVVNELYCQFRASGKKCFSPKGKLSSQQMKKVIDLVKSSLHSEIHLCTMASEVHLSDFHFSRLFRNTFGISPYQYVLQSKVEYAKTLLRHYPRSLSQIAHSLNFTDQSHFTNVFKKLTGICPSDFAMNRVKSVA